MNTRLLAAALLAWGCTDAGAPSRGLSEPEAEESVVVTQWTERTELFMESLPLRLGTTSRFAIHLTDLASFKPLDDGQVTVTLDYGGGRSEAFTALGPSQPGIFGVDVDPKTVGTPTLTITLRSRGVEDSHDLGPTSVVDPSRADGPSPAPTISHHDDGAISFLKEQQWSMEFATEVVGSAAMRESLLVPAIVEPRGGGRILVTAPVSGFLLHAVRLPALGDSLVLEQEIAAIGADWEGLPDRSTLKLAIDEAQTNLETAKRETARTQRLLDVGAIAARRLADAEAEEALAVARHEAAVGRMRYYETSRIDAPQLEPRATFSVRAHLAGVVSALFVRDGAHVGEGDPLLEVTATDIVRVSGAIPESRAAVLSQLRGAEVVLPESSGTMRVGSLEAAVRVVDPATRTLKASYAVDNRSGRLAIGQSVHMRLFTSHPTEVTIVPRSAIVDDRGQPTVYVQTGGETFAARRVELGARQGDWVQVRSGVSSGERVVSEGAFLVRLASRSEQTPSHGHAH